MSQAQVRSLCGEPKFAFGGSRAAIWHYFNENIYQVFFDESGRVEMMDETLVTPGGCGVGVQILP